MDIKHERVLRLTKAYRAGSIALLTVLAIGISAAARNASSVASDEQFSKQFGPIIRAKQNEGKSSVNALNRAQQAYYVEKGRLASNFAQLGTGTNPESGNYSYRIGVVNARSAKATASAKDSRIRSYIGAVFVIGSGSNARTITGICESGRATRTPPAMPRLVSNNIQCPAGSTKL